MTEDDDQFVVKGLEPLIAVPDISIVQLFYEKLKTDNNEAKALIDAITGRSITYKEILGKSCSLAASLRRCGYKENVVMAICSENCIEFFIPILAALYIGAAVAPINYTCTESEMIHCLNISKPTVIFCSQHNYSYFADIKNKLSFIERIIIIDNVSGTDKVESIDSFINRCLVSTDLLYTFSLAEVNTDSHLAFILYSSGTTGLPKGVMVTHRNVLAKFVLASDPRFLLQKEIESSLSSYTIGLLPFFHAYGLFTALGCIYKGITTIVMARFDEHLFLKTIEKYRISLLLLVPPLALFLCKSPLVEKYDLSSVTGVSCAAASLSEDIELCLKKRFKVESIAQGYGMTETTLAVVATPIDQLKVGSVGKVLPDMLCKIRDPESGKSLGPNQVGEICVKGPSVMKGYYGNEEATKNSFTTNGWLITGDLGYYDEDEYFFIVGRQKEVIKYKGFQVAPAELEALLLSHKNIKDAAVIGLENEEAGELPLAFIVKANSKLTEEEVVRFVAGKVSPHKRLRGGVRFISEIPKNPSGKILRRILQDKLTVGHKSKL